MAHPFLERLGRGPVLGDGAMGTLLRSYGLRHAGAAEAVEAYNLSQSDWVREAHLGYIRAGAELIEANTFAASRPHLAEHGGELAARVRDINFRGVKLAREAREISGQPVWIGGTVGPLGRGAYHIDGTLNAAAALAAFREQIAVLLEAGADVLVLETFSDLDELSLAIRAARETSDLPIVAEMTFGNEGVTATGVSPAQAAAALAALRVDVAGVNCSMGPARVLDAVAEMHRAEPDVRLSAMPNAGLPYRTREGMVYPSAPHYFARHVASFLAAGAMLLGGCCGSTPGHIQAMRGALDQALADKGRAGFPGATLPTPGLPAAELVAVPMVRASTPATLATAADANAPEPTGLLRKIRAGDFVVSVEVDPPRGFNPEKTLEGARIAKEHGADAVNVADSPMARVRMGALALCVLIQQQVGIETVLHYTTRDRSLMGLQADLIGAHALGVRNIIALTGDPPSLGDSPDSTPVYDVDSIGLVRIISQFNAGNDRAGKPFGSRAGFTIAVACDPTRPDVSQEADRLAAKIEAGAHLVMTQPIFDVPIWQHFVAVYEERHGRFPLPVLAGVLPLQSYRHASFLHNEVPGIRLPETALARMERAGADGRSEGVRMAQELLLQLRELPAVCGVYLMPSFGRYEMACEVMDVLSR
jgi:methionine synthase I (cobalamin-dependent)/5,10-methylenetetrahydrofolate reductase